MRTDRKCPKCRGRRFIVAPEASIANPEKYDGTAPLHVVDESNPSDGAFR